MANFSCSLCESEPELLRVSDFGPDGQTYSVGANCVYLWHMVAAGAFRDSVRAAIQADPDDAMTSGVASLIAGVDQSTAPLFADASGAPAWVVPESAVKASHLNKHRTVQSVPHASDTDIGADEAWRDSTGDPDSEDWDGE